GQLREGGCTRIVGVAEDVRRTYLNPEATPALYRPRAQAPAGQSPFGFRGMILLVRTTGDPGDILADVRRAMQQVAPNMPFVEVQRFETRLDPVVRPFRLGASLFTAFGLLALLLAAVGLYGVIANLVAERTHEVGVRMSLGAARREVVGLVVRQGMRPVLLGLVIGVAAALAGARLLESMLHGVPARDPLTIGIVAVTLPLVAAVASWLPARRAARVDPVIALRAE
ncbi:MAG: FtsX-like permease family protein, partial [Gemmatimonadota bacterium]